MRLVPMVETETLSFIELLNWYKVPLNKYYRLTEVKRKMAKDTIRYKLRYLRSKKNTRDIIVEILDNTKDLL